MAQIDYEKILKAFSTILPHFLICIQIEDKGTVTLPHFLIYMRICYTLTLTIIAISSIVVLPRITAS
jgi:hypothetical protein